MPNNDFLNNLIRFDPRLVQSGRLEVIVKYNGDIMRIGNELGVDVEILDENYAILTGNVDQIVQLYNYYQYKEIEYIELPKTMTFELIISLSSSCISPVKTRFGLTGSGTIIGLIDSGIDYTHPDFINDDGTSRILYIWDQTGTGTPPEGFRSGVEYNNEDINTALKNREPLSVLPFTDEAGHGTAVAGIAAGNGRTSRGREAGVAPQSSLIVVKLGQRGYEAFARTTEIMRGFKYIVDKAEALNMPVSINLSYGTNNGAHDGNSLFEQYIDSVSQRWKTSISVAVGNEGASGHHYSNTMRQNQTVPVEFAASGNVSKMYMTLWKNFADTFTYELVSPNGTRSGQISPTTRFYLLSLDNVNITIFFNYPTNYSQAQEIYFLFEGRGGAIPQGIWQLNVTGNNVVDGNFDIWLPTLEDVANETSFTVPSAETTLTLPSTAEKVISVGGYNANTVSIASFSGRGYTWQNVYVKPDIVAPAVNILTTKTGGGYDVFSGTSMAAPFVTGSAALMMEWGIIQGNDQFLYGQKIKAFLQKGAERSSNIIYPNNQWGYGTLCLNNTMDLLIEFSGGGISFE